MSTSRLRPPSLKYQLAPALLPPMLSRWQPPATHTREDLLDMQPLGPFEDPEDYTEGAPDDPRVVWPELPPSDDAEDAEPEQHLAEPRDLLTDEEMCVQPSEHQKGWLESDCVPVSEDGCTAELAHADGARQSILSRDWLHVDHASRTRSWRVHASKATYAFGDIYFGISEAQAFNQPGRTFLFDVHGNARYGYHPLELVLMWGRSEVETMSETSFVGDFRGDKSDTLVVTLDLRNRLFTVYNETSGDTLIHKLGCSPPIRSARLCASLQTMGDAVVIG